MTSSARRQHPADLPIPFVPSPQFPAAIQAINPNQLRSLLAQGYGELMAMLTAKLCTGETPADQARVREALHHIAARLLRKSQEGTLLLDLTTWKAYVVKSAIRAYFYREKRDQKTRPHQEIETSEGESQAVEPTSYDPSVEGGIEVEEDLALQARFVAELPDTLRWVIELRLKDLSHRQIAEQLGISETAARKRYSTAVAVLAKRFGVPKKTAHTRRSHC